MSPSQQGARTAVRPEVPKRFRRTDVRDVIRSHPALTASEVSVLRILDSFCYSDRVRCWPSVPTIAQLGRISDRTVQRALKELGAEGLVVVEDADTRTGRVFLLPWRVIPGDTMSPPGNTMSPPRCHRVTAPGATVSPEFSREFGKKKQQQKRRDVVVAFREPRETKTFITVDDEFDGWVRCDPPEDGLGWPDWMDQAPCPTVVRKVGEAANGEPIYDSVRLEPHEIPEWKAPDDGQPDDLVL